MINFFFGFPYQGVCSILNQQRKSMHSHLDSFAFVFLTPNKKKMARVLIVKPDWSFSDLLHKLSEKFEMEVTDIFLETAENELLAIDDVEEIQEGDNLLVKGNRVPDSKLFTFGCEKTNHFFLVFLF